ncbi:MAG: HYR domain-containing protein, partial [Planctomycetota bacterium]
MRSMAVVLACAAMLAAPAARGVEQIIGDVDGFGFSDPANGWDLASLQQAGGGPADANGDGILTEGEAIPDLNGNGNTAIGSGDDFDNRSPAEKADADGTGAKWTDVTLLTGPSSVQPPITSPGTPADPVFVFRFPVPTPDDPDFGLDHILNIVAADFDVPPFTITVDGKDVNGTALGPGIPDGGITVTIVNVPWTDMLDGKVVVEFKKMVNEPFIAIDYLRLSTHAGQAGQAGTRCADGDLTTGVDNNGDGRDDHWVVFRPDGVVTLPNVIDPPDQWWRGGSGLAANTGPFLGGATYPVLGKGRWIDGGGTVTGAGRPTADLVGVYTYRCTFDLAGFASYVFLGEWAADNELREIRINGIPVSGVGCACAAPYVDNASGQLVTTAGPLDNFQRIHRFEITDQALFRFTPDADGKALNTIEIDVYNEGNITGLLLTGGAGTSAPGGPAGLRGVPILFDGKRNWSDTLAVQPTAGPAAASESYAVVELTDDNRRLLLDALERAGAALLRHEPGSGTPGGFLHPLNMRGRYLYLYQAENDVPCLQITRFTQRGAFHNVGLVVPARGGQSGFLLRDVGDAAKLDRSSRLLTFVPAGAFAGGRVTLPGNGGTLEFTPAGAVARDCNGQQPVASAIYWGLSDQPPALTAHVATWSGIDPQTGQPVTGRHETLQAGSNSPPVPRCVGEFTLALGADGTAVLDAAKLDAGSFDVDGTIVQTAVSRTTFSCPDLGDQTVRFTVTDDDGASASCDVLVHVVDTQAPALTLPADVTIECDRERFEATIAPERTGSATATDNCDAQSAGCQRQAAATGGNQARTRAQDVATGSTTTTATGRGVQGIMGKGSHSTIAASTNPALVASSPAPSGCGVQLSYSDRTVSEACPIVIERTWTATDSAGNQTSGVQTITVVDTSPPVIALPKPITIGCGDPIDPDFTGAATATDSCDPTPTLRYEDSEESVAVDPGATGPVVYRRILRTWIATDACGNEAREVQTIDIQDAAPPAPVCVGSLTLELGSDGTLTLQPEQLADGPLGAMDDCGVAAATLSRSRFTGADVPMRDPATVTLTLTDVAGRTGSCLTQLTVIDRVPPVIERCVPARTIESAAACRALAPDLTSELVASDNDHIASITQDPAPGTALGAGEYVFTFTVTDDSGNATSCSTLVRVTDPPPVALADHYAVDEDGTLAVDANRGLLANDTDPAQQANAAPTLTAAAGPDAPAHGSVTVEASGAFTYTPDPDYFGTDRFTYRVTDACGQSAIGEVTIELRPVQDPPT